MEPLNRGSGPHAFACLRDQTDGHRARGARGYASDGEPGNRGAADAMRLARCGLAQPRKRLDRVATTSTIASSSTTAMASAAPDVPLKVDRQHTTPFLLKLFYRQGGFHRCVPLRRVSVVRPSLTLCVQSGRVSCLLAAPRSHPDLHVARLHAA